MRKLTIKNIGPIKEAKLDLNKINVFMGPQSSGKSTIAKIISYCTWVEKNVATNQSFEAFEKDKNFFRERLESFHKIKGYFKLNSIIEYESEVIKLKYTPDNFKIEWVDQYAYKRSKISYIPAERNMVILPEMEKVEFPHNNIRSFLFDWFDARKLYPSDGGMPVLNLGLSYYYSESSKENHVQYIDNGDSYDITLPNASSGLQSIIPMIVMIEYLTERIYNQEEKLSYEQEQQRMIISNKIFSDVALQPYYGEKFSDWDIEYARSHAMQKRAKEGDKKAEELIERFVIINKNLFITQNSQLIIEEAEQNLFPETQHDFIYYLLEKCNGEERDHRVTLTTHSPYILYALNNCMMAHLVWDKMREQDKEKIKCKNALIDPKKISIYQIEKGYLACIQQEDGLIGNNYFDEKMKELMDDFYIMLNYYK